MDDTIDEKKVSNPHKKTARKISRPLVKITHEMNDAINTLANALQTEKTNAFRLLVVLSVKFAKPEEIKNLIYREGYQLNTTGGFGGATYPISFNLTLTEILERYIDEKMSEWEISKTAVIRGLCKWGQENIDKYSLADFLNTEFQTEGE